MTICRTLRTAQIYNQHVFPKNGFDNPKDDDAFVIAQNDALQKGILKLSEHPLWTLEKDPISLMNKYGLKSEDDKFLFETAKYYCYLNKVMLFWDRFRLTFDRKSQEVSIILGKEATRDDIENSLSTIFTYKKKILGKGARKSEVFQFDQHLAFYKAFLLMKKHNASWLVKITDDLAFVNFPIQA